MPTFRPVLALAFLIGAHCSFTLLDASGKGLAVIMGIPLISLARHGIQVVLMLAMFGPANGRKLIQTRHPGLQLARGITLTGFTVFFFTALSYLPQAEATAINFLTPFAVMILAGPLLGETVTWRRWLGAVLGFSGMLIIIRPGSGLDGTGVFFVLLTVLCNIAFQLLTRKLATQDDHNSTVFLTALIGVIVSLLLLPLQSSWGGWPQDLNLEHWLMLAMLGITGTISQLCLIRAYYWSSASFIAPLVFLQMLWAAAAGWLFFGQFPPPLNQLGMVLILAGGVLMMWLETTQSKRLRKVEQEIQT